MAESKSEKCDKLIAHEHEIIKLWKSSIVSNSMFCGNRYYNESTFEEYIASNKRMIYLYTNRLII